MSPRQHFGPLLVTRVSNTLPGVAAVGCGVGVLFDSQDVLLQVGGIILIPAGLWVAVRGYKVGVVLQQGIVTVHGYVRTVRIPKSTVVEVASGPTPSIDGSGTIRMQQRGFGSGRKLAGRSPSSVVIAPASCAGYDELWKDDSCTALRALLMED